MTALLVECERLLFKEVAKGLNNMYGQTSTAPLSVGLFLKLPIKISFVEAVAPIDRSDVTSCFAAYTKIDDEVNVYFDFFYKNEKDMKNILKTISKFNTYWAYIYQHELLHILLKHVTVPFHNRMMRFAKEHAPKDMPESLYPKYINIAEDYFINYSIADMVDYAVKAGLDAFLATSLYNDNYRIRKNSDIEILIDILNQTNINVKEVGKYAITTVTDNVTGEKSTHIGIPHDPTEPTEPATENGEAGTTSTAQNTLTDTELKDLADSIHTTIQNQIKGSTTSATLKELFESIQVNTDWFKKISLNFKRDVYYITNEFYTKWSNLNNRYRRVFKSPKKYFVDNKVNIVLSIDQSGSMPQDSLQKLLYLIEEEGKSINNLTVLIHDTVVTKEFELLSTDNHDITENSNFKAALATRYQSGGTSHEDVFNWLQNNVKDPNKTIYMSFSDNYSDIEYVWGKFPILKIIKTYLICPVNNPMNVPATNILME